MVIRISKKLQHHVRLDFTKNKLDFIISKKLKIEESKLKKKIMAILFF
jgi:hypothetical protein